MSKSDPRDAISDMKHGLANVFKKYNKSARSTAWNSIEKNPRTKDLMRKLVLSPDRPIHGTSTLLTFKEWMKSQ